MQGFFCSKKVCNILFSIIIVFFFLPEQIIATKDVKDDNVHVVSQKKGINVSLQKVKDGILFVCKELKNNQLDDAEKKKHVALLGSSLKTLLDIKNDLHKKKECSNKEKLLYDSIDSLLFDLKEDYGDVLSPVVKGIFTSNIRLGVKQSINEVGEAINIIDSKIDVSILEGVSIESKLDKLIPIAQTINSKVDITSDQNLTILVSLSDHHESIESKLDKLIPIAESILEQVEGIEIATEVFDTVNSKVDDLFVSLSDHHESIESKLDKLIPIAESILDIVEDIDLETKIKTCLTSPYNITAPGSYILCGSASQVTISSGDVWLDLNGYVIDDSTGIEIDSGLSGIYIANGFINGSGYGIHIHDDTEKVIIENILINGEDASPTSTAGIFFDGATTGTGIKGCKVKDCTILHYLEGVKATEMNECTFENVEVKSGVFFGFTLENSSYNHFYLCKVLDITNENVLPGPPQGLFGFLIKDASSMGNSIKECIIKNIRNTATVGNIACGISSGPETKIRDCEIMAIISDNSLGIGIQVLSKCVIENNNILNNGIGIMSTEDNIINGNTISQHINGIFIPPSFPITTIFPGRNTITNNIIQKCSSRGISTFRSDNIIDNNKFEDCGTGSPPPAGSAITYLGSNILTRNIAFGCGGSTTTSPFSPSPSNETDITAYTAPPAPYDNVYGY